MKIAIVGAGVSGIACLKYASETGHECDCFEETDSYGGTWVYTSETGIDDNGQPIYRNMYKNLVTHLPKQIMEFSGFPNNNSEENTYMKQPEVLQYITEYVNAHNLEHRIKFNHQVTKVEPQPQGRWLIWTKNRNTIDLRSALYDFVFICSGRCRYPKIPQITGQDIFEGLQMHSCNYRTPDIFKNRRVLIIGAFSSGLDICRHIKSVTKKVFLSHWKSVSTRIQNFVCCKPAVARLINKAVVFTDNTLEEIDCILYCTGYEYKFPFLTETCGITICDNWVNPLYKDIVNIEHPTMFFIGIPLWTAAFLVSDIQARFIMAIIDKKIVLPSKSEMLDELHNHIENLKKNMVPQRYYHKLGLKQRQYFSDLDKIGFLKSFPPFFNDMFEYVVLNLDTVYLSTDRSVYLDNR